MKDWFEDKLSYLDYLDSKYTGALIFIAAMGLVIITILTIIMFVMKMLSIL